MKFRKISLQIAEREREQVENKCNKYENKTVALKRNKIL